MTAATTLAANVLDQHQMLRRDGQEWCDCGWRVNGRYSLGEHQAAILAALGLLASGESRR